jgi:hypothetical protein
MQHGTGTHGKPRHRPLASAIGSHLTLRQAHMERAVLHQALHGKIEQHCAFPLPMR